MTKCFAIVELMGHVRLVGEVEEVEAIGGRMLAVSEICRDGSRKSRLCGLASIYGITPLSGMADALEQAGVPEPGVRAFTDCIDELSDLVQHVRESLQSEKLRNEERRREQLKRSRERLAENLEQILGLYPADRMYGNDGFRAHVKVEEVVLFDNGTDVLRPFGLKLHADSPALIFRHFSEIERFLPQEWGGKGEVPGGGGVAYNPFEDNEDEDEDL